MFYNYWIIDSLTVCICIYVSLHLSQNHKEFFLFSFWFLAYEKYSTYVSPHGVLEREKKEMLGVLDKLMMVKLLKDMQISWCFVYIGFECSHHFNSDYHSYNNWFMYYVLAVNIFFIFSPNHFIYYQYMLLIIIIIVIWYCQIFINTISQFTTSCMDLD